MEPDDPNEALEADACYHSHKPGERRFSEDPVVFPEKEVDDCPAASEERCGPRS
jgi:hypothetical protein